MTISRHEIESGSATLSTPPVEKHLPMSAKILIGVGIGLAALAVIISHMVPYT